MVKLEKLGIADMDAAATVHRTAFDNRMPWLAGLHTPEEDREYFREKVFHDCEVWGAIENSHLVGILAFRLDWIDQLYVLPNVQSRGVGTKLLVIAQTHYPRLHLWTFQRNGQARRFYEKRGFILIEETDGLDNAEKEPDALYLWKR